MTKEKRLLYQKAFVELYEMIKMLSDEEREKIPDQFLDYIRNNMDVNYEFRIDNSVGLLEQNYMIETQALIVKLYEKFFSSEDEKEFWNKYHKVCFNMIEGEKSKKYNSNSINIKPAKIVKKIDENNDNNVEKNNSLVEYKKNFFQSLLNKIKNTFFKL